MFDERREGVSGLAKKNANPASSFFNVKLQVPRGLWGLLGRIEPLTGLSPKQYLENQLAHELEYMLGNIDGTLFNLKAIRTRYGEGSNLNE
jgi:hypothetical protein